MSAPAMRDFFVCDFLGAVPKHDLASMEHPLFSLSTRPDRRILTYAHNGTEVTITPSVKGRATIFDADILIFCISQLTAALNAGREVARTLTLTAHDLLSATGRETSGDGYRRLRDAFERGMHGILPDLNLLLELEHTEAIKRAVEPGLGISCLSRVSLREAFRRGSLVPLAVPHRDFSREFYFVLHRQKYRSPGVERWLQLCRESRDEG